MNGLTIPKCFKNNTGYQQLCQIAIFYYGTVIRVTGDE